MSTNPHPNIVQFLGAVTIPGQFKIVTELLDGDVKQLLHSNTGKRMSLFARLKLMKDAALGMMWLHNSTPQIIHRDFKPNNLLLVRQGDDYRVKVCDFGLSAIKRIETDKLKADIRGTPMYMAPEVMRREFFDAKADVYSFGIVLWETATVQKPYPHIRSYTELKEKVLESGERPPIADDMMPALADLIQRCWSSDPEARPGFGEINKALDKIITFSALEDPLGREFWLAHISPKFSVTWPEFAQLLWNFIGCELPNDPESGIGEDPTPVQPPKPTYISKPQPTRRPSSRGRRGAKQKPPAEEETTSTAPPASSNKATVAQLNVRCVKALLLDDGNVEHDSATISQFNKMLKWFAPFEASEEFFNRIRTVLSQKWFFWKY
eukprot:TRINITY_DN413_c0_g2_i1.p1 TRINITY_DN413_c0_g2~~TRINITY_DN413_c0_g2_i1.p1  ORF type:complete len:387 (-),score=68.97 TRINITY_DN413_c0_g2_i1:1271-2410(-)